MHLIDLAMVVSEYQMIVADEALGNFLDSTLLVDSG